MADWATAAATLGSAAINTGGTFLGSLVNMDFNKEQFNYQKELQKLLMEREDNAMQRKLADYSAAGYSPLAALEGSAGGSVGAIANTAHYSDIGSIISNGAAQTGNLLNSGMQNVLTAARDSANTRIAEANISLNQYIAEMQNDTKLKEIYLDNQQFYDKMAQDDEHFRTQLSQAADEAAKERLCRENIAALDRQMNLQISRMKDNTQRDALRQEWAAQKRQLDHEVSQLNKQQTWQAKQNKYDRLVNMYSTTVNGVTNLVKSFIPFSK